MKRILKPSTNMAGLSAAAGAIYAAALMIYHVLNHQAAFSVPVAIAGIGAALALLTRQSVTPIADPLDGNGKPLTSANPTLDQIAQAAQVLGLEIVPSVTPVTGPGSSQAAPSAQQSSRVVLGSQPQQG
jgi:hypothetical protein